MPKHDLIRLSQGHLNLLSACPPMFQQVYLDGLSSLPEPEQQTSMQWGSKFHLLMQQRELALPIDSLLTTDAELDLCFKALIAANPYLRSQHLDIWREAEHSRSITSGCFLLTVVYDLLVTQVDRALIFDWKTHRTPQRRRKIENNWQTRLYLYVLAQTSEYTPEQIQMTYWFVKSGKPESITIKYDQQQHQQTEEDLADLLNQLRQWLEDYAQFNLQLPHKANCGEQICHYRQFLLTNDFDESNHQELSKSISEVEEISI